MSKEDERMSTADLGYIRLSQISGEALDPARIQRGISASMSGVIADALRGGSNPQKLDPVEKVRPIDAGKVETAREAGVSEAGWYSPKPLGGSSRTDELIEQLVNSELPHGEKSRAK
jgi:hypothetical protein